jgi:hypothetical protein
MRKENFKLVTKIVYLEKLKKITFQNGRKVN